MKLARFGTILLIALLAACGAPGRTTASDRGIGGTGAPTAGPEIGDRGIGGTGIVGVITGFGSVFVNGLEVAYTPSTPITVDGVTESTAAMQAGQLVAITAKDGQGLHATAIAVRHEVSGPVTSVSPGASPGSQVVTVVGQRVAIGATTDGLRVVRPGDWIAVSGLRQPDGVITASRIDLRPPGPILVRGPAVPSAGGWRIGGLRVRPPAGSTFTAGESVTAQGRFTNGILVARVAKPDVLSANPAAFFGSHVRRMVIEAYVSSADGHVRLGHGLLATTAPGTAVPAGTHRAIVEFDRGAHGGFIATRLREPGAFTPRGTPPVQSRHSSFAPPRAAPGSLGAMPHWRSPWANRPPGFARGENARPYRKCAPGLHCGGGRGAWQYR